MNKRFLLCFLFFIKVSVCFCENTEFIKIDSTEHFIIGSNKYFYYNDYLTSVEPKEKDFYYPETKIKLDNFYISENLITDKIFNEFLKETNLELKSLKEYEYWKDFWKRNKESDKIFTFATYYEALVFVDWLSTRDGKTYRFPTNAEWEYACMQSDKSIYPFGAQDGKFTSIKNTNENNFSFFENKEVKEDYSEYGVFSVSVSQYVLDSFDGKTYASFNYFQKNPLMLSDTTFVSLRSGGYKYNTINSDDWGLMFQNDVEFDSDAGSTNIAIRLIEDHGTIFNAETDDACIYFQNTGIVKYPNTCLLKTNEKKNNSSNIKMNSNVPVLILFKSFNGKYFKVFTKIEDEWETGWVLSNNIQITNKNWYEIVF